LAETLSGHPGASGHDDVAAELNGPRRISSGEEFFFDDDTFKIQKARTIELCSKLKPLNLTWSCTSRVTRNTRRSRP